MVTLVFGAGGHALELVAIAQRSGVLDVGDSEVRFVIGSAAAPRRSELPFPVITESQIIGFLRGQAVRVILAVGAGPLRSRIDAELVKLGITVEFPNIIDPTTVTLGPLAPANGLVTFPHTFVSERVTFGRHCHLNVGSSISHEAVLGDFVTVSPQAVICGRARIGALSFIGANATVIDGVHVVAETTIGAGSTVVCALTQPGTYVGAPARAIRN